MSDHFVLGPNPGSNRTHGGPNSLLMLKLDLEVDLAADWVRDRQAKKVRAVAACAKGEAW
jgi:hypothetical protein